MENGWIKLHRKILVNPLTKKPYYLALWITLLLKANHEPTKMIWNNKILIVKEGQFITGRKSLSEQTGISESTIEDILNFLENEGQIQQQKTTKYRIITILNWKSYQERTTRDTTKQQQGIQQADTNKNDKKYKNDKKDTLLSNGLAEASSAEWSFKDEIKKLEDSPRRDLNIIALYFDEKNPDIRNKGQFSTALRRHLRPAKELSPFEDTQILEAMKKARKQTEEWTLETIIKYATK